MTTPQETQHTRTPGKLTRYMVNLAALYPHEDGHWCHYTDVEALESANATMLEALKGLVETAGVSTKDAVDEALTKARAAIAKAEGKEP